MNTTVEKQPRPTVFKMFGLWLLAGPLVFLAMMVLASSKEEMGYVFLITALMSAFLLLILGAVNVVLALIVHWVCGRFHKSLRFQKVVVMLIWIIFGGIVAADEIQRTRPEERFKWLVIDPIPASVRNIQVGGMKPFSGEIWELKFDIDPKDFEKIIQTRGFERAELPKITEEEVAELRKSGKSPKDILYYRYDKFAPYHLPFEPLEEPEAYKLKPWRNARSYEFTGILTNKAHTKVYFIDSYE